VVADAFNARQVGVLGLQGEVAVFGEVEPEPSVPSLEKLLAVAEQVRPDLVVGFGGGSAMDLAKLAAVLPGSGQRAGDRGRGRARAGEGTGQCPRPGPTTSGTGSKAGTRALVTDPAAHNKLAVQSRHMLADLAAVDPELTLIVPRAVTGVDALAHCAEAFTSRKAHPLIDVYTLEGIRLVGRHLARAVEAGSDLEARAGL
jgi:alcohol dehydrogenase class IV